MPVPAHVRLSFTGCFGPTATPLEIWMFNINLQDRPFADEAERVAFASSVADSWGTTLGPMHAPNTHLQKVRVANVQAGGLVGRNAEGGYNQGDWLGTKSGSKASSVIQPIQTAVCVSLGTARSGPSGRGRCFLPMLGAGVQADFRYDATEIQQVAVNFKNLLLAIDGLSAVNGEPCVVSSYGFTSRINSVRVGRVPDTMRSRRGNLQEDYYELAVTA